MAERHEPARNKILIFHLRGARHGPHQVRSDQAAAEAQRAAQRLWTMTMHGVIGRRFDWYEPDGTQRRYQVVDKKEVDDEIIITCDCVSEGSKPVSS